MMDKAVALYRVEDTLRGVLVLRLTASSFLNYPAKSSDAGLEEGCFFSVIAAAQCGKLLRVSWLHIIRMNELNWKTNERNWSVSLPVFSEQICFLPHFYMVKDQKGVKIMGSEEQV